jgi:hypothetical protein
MPAVPGAAVGNGESPSTIGIGLTTTNGPPCTSSLPVPTTAVLAKRRPTRTRELLHRVAGDVRGGRGPAVAADGQGAERLPDRDVAVQDLGIGAEPGKVVGDDHVLPRIDGRRRKLQASDNLGGTHEPGHAASRPAFELAHVAGFGVAEDAVARRRPQRGVGRSASPRASAMTATCRTGVFTARFGGEKHAAASASRARYSAVERDGGCGLPAHSRIVARARTIA